MLKGIWIESDSFSGNKNEDAHDHSDRVLNIVSLFNILGVSQDAVLLRVFPFTLTGSAKRWVDRLTPGAINTWDLLYIQRYCPPSKTAKRLKDIHNFKQESDESLYQAWERWTKLDNLGRDMKKLKENVYAIQVGCQICEGPHLDKECPLNEEVKQVEEVKYGEFGRPTPFNGSNRAKFHVGPPGYYTRTHNRPPYGSKTTNEAPSLSTEQCKMVNADHEMTNIHISSSKLNNLNRVSDAQRDQNKKERETKVLQCQLPPKELNPGNFTLPCTIVFDMEIEQLTDEYELGIRKKGHILEMIWENCKNIQGLLEGKQKSSGGIFDNIKYLILFSVKCKYVTRNTGKGRNNEENTDSYEALRHHGFVGYPLTNRVTLGFGSIMGSLDHVNPVIRLPLEHEISRVLGKFDHPDLNIAGYVTNVGRTNHLKSGSKNLDFHLANHRQREVNQTYAMGKPRGDKVYLSSTSSTMIVDDSEIPTIKALKNVNRCPDNNTLRGQVIDAKNLRFEVKKHEDSSTFPETFLQIEFVISRGRKMCRIYHITESSVVADLHYK
ncbi:hypothetical protein Tco_1375934 [Tanacetum coccineum]